MRQKTVLNKRTILDFSREHGSAGTSWLLRTLVGCMVIFFSIYNPYEKSFINIVLGCVLLIVSLQPLDVWLCLREKRTVPVFELHLVFYALCFGVAAFVTPDWYLGGITVDEPTYTLGLIAGLVGVISLRIGFALASLTKGRLISGFKPDFSRTDPVLTVFIFYPFLVLVTILAQKLEINNIWQMTNVLRVFLFVWGAGLAFTRQLRLKLKFIILFLFFPIELLLFGGIAEGKLAGFLVYGELIGVAYAVIKNRIPIMIVVVIAISFFLLQPVKDHYRSLTWGKSRNIGIIEGIELFSSMAVEEFSGKQDLNKMRKNFNATYTRINHLHLVSEIITVVPRIQPYLNGETLLPLLTKWIPRAIWPDKPKEDLGNRWAKEFGYLMINDFSTSFNLPWLAEMFMNFSWYGVVGINLLIGWMIGEFMRGCVLSDQSISGVAFSLAVGSAFFFPESNISLQLGNIIVSWISIFIFRLVLLTLPPKSGHRV